jgi:hypothetical protein
MGENLKEVKPETLKELKLEFATFEGKFDMSKLFDRKIQETIKNQLGHELMIPLVLFSYAENKFILVMYASSKDFVEGKAILASDKPENVKEFYNALSKILISTQE